MYHDQMAFCSAHLCKLLPKYQTNTVQQIPSALRTCASCFDRGDNVSRPNGLLLCALVQVASRDYPEYAWQDCFCSAHLCKLLQPSSGIPPLAKRASALRTCASCFADIFLLIVFLLLLLCALVQVASIAVTVKCSLVVFLLLCALVQVASDTIVITSTVKTFCSAHLCKLLLCSGLSR